MNQQSVTQEDKEEKTRVLGFTAARQLTEQEIYMVSGALKSACTDPRLLYRDVCGNQTYDEA